MTTTNLNPLDYNLFVLAGVTDHNRIDIITYTNWTPNTKEIETLISQLKTQYKGFLILSPVNIINQPNKIKYENDRPSDKNIV